MKCLGHILSSSCPSSPDFSDARAQAWGAFYANFGPGLRTSSTATKLRFLNSCVLPILSFRWAQWAWQTSLAQRIDSLQRHMTTLLFPVKPRPSEDTASYFLRRSRVMGQIAQAVGSWSQAWAHQLETWNAHVRRRHDSRVWSHHLIDWHATQWLEDRRALASRRGQYRGTATRSLQGPPARRWQDGFLEAPSGAPPKISQPAVDKVNLVMLRAAE